MKIAKFEITTEVEDDKDMEILEKKLHYFINNLYGVNTKVKWLSNTKKDNTVKGSILKDTNSNNIIILDSNNLERINNYLNYLQQQLLTISKSVDERLNIHRVNIKKNIESIKAHTSELQHIREVVAEHTMIGNGLHNE